ncbi:STAS domain-containing protein [Patescibacteria group bacterium]|nr:STAS domain-containing protein [Patescibacteria group bacterium]
MADVQTTLQDLDVNGKMVKMISFIGQLDETNVDEEAKKIYQAIDEMSEPNLLLDFSELAYMNSKSIGYVTDWYSRASAKNGKIAITNARPNILDILKVVGITQIVTIYNTTEEAKSAFSGGSAPAETPIAPVAPVAKMPEEKPKEPVAVAAAPAPELPQEPSPEASVPSSEASAPSESAPPTPPAV